MAGTVGGRRRERGGEGLVEEGVGPGEHGRRSHSAADLVWYRHVSNSARQGTFNPEIVCVYARWRRLIHCVLLLLFGGAEVLGQPELKLLVWLFFFSWLHGKQQTADRSRDPKQRSDGTRTEFLLSVTFASWNIFSLDPFFIFKCVRDADSSIENSVRVGETSSAARSWERGNRVRESHWDILDFSTFI